MRLFEAILLVLVILLAAGFSIGLRELGLWKIAAIPIGMVLALVSVALALYGLSKIGTKAD
jgi:hypothetical protein